MYNDQNNLGYIILEAPSVDNLDAPKVRDISKDEVIIETVLQEVEAPNRNKRLYTRAAIESGINNPMFQEKLKKKNLFGEANHPISDSVERYSVIDMTRMSHVITNVWWEGNLLMGEVASTNTACGKDFAGLVRQGCQMAFSMRGLGGVVKKEGELTVVHNPLLIITYDNVIYPSHQKAYQTKILREEAKLMQSNPIFLSEGVMIPCDYKEAIKNFIMNESKQVQDAVDQLELDPRTATLAENDQLSVSLKTDEGRVILFTEDNIKKEINNFLANL